MQEIERKSYTTMILFIIFLESVEVRIKDNYI